MELLDTADVEDVVSEFCVDVAAPVELLTVSEFELVVPAMMVVAPTEESEPLLPQPARHVSTRSPAEQRRRKDDLDTDSSFWQIRIG